MKLAANSCSKFLKFDFERRNSDFEMRNKHILCMGKKFEIGKIQANIAKVDYCKASKFGAHFNKCISWIIELELETWTCKREVLLAQTTIKVKQELAVHTAIKASITSEKR